MEQKQFEFTSFESDLIMSHGVCVTADVQSLLMSQIPGATQVEQATAHEDRCGTDWWVRHRSGNSFSVDAKVRRQDYSVMGKDDLALETWSVIGSAVGWTRDSQKRTDYILWLWVDTGRWCLVPFPMLCAVFIDKWQDYRSQYQVAVQNSEHCGLRWQSECVYVPRDEVWRQIYQRYAGTPQQWKQPNDGAAK